MSPLPFGAAAHQRHGEVFDEPKSDKSSVDTTWMVLEAANDLGDDSTVEACRRVIDANLRGRLASPSDLNVILDYFR